VFETEEPTEPTVESEASTAVVYYEQDFDAFDAEVAALVETVRIARDRWNRTALRQRIARRWALLVVLTALAVLVGFVFGRGLLDVASLLSLGTMLPVSTIADWGKGSVDSTGFAHPLEYGIRRPSAARPVLPFGVLCTCWGCMGFEDCWVYQS
jgi:hypothetical protein